MKNCKQFEEVISRGERVFYTDKIDMVNLKWHEKKVIDTKYYPNYKEKQEKSFPDRTKMPYFKTQTPSIKQMPLLLEYIDEGEYQGNFKILLTDDIVLKNISTSNTLLLENTDYNNPQLIVETYEALINNPMTVNIKNIVPFCFLTQSEKQQLSELLNNRFNSLLIKFIKKECQMNIKNGKDIYKEIIKQCPYNHKEDKTKKKRN